MDNNKNNEKSSKERVMVDVGVLYEDLRTAMLKDGLHHKDDSKNLQEYIRNMILKPFLEYRNHFDMPPTMAQLISNQSNPAA